MNHETHILSIEFLRVTYFKIDRNGTLNGKRNIKFDVCTAIIEETNFSQSLGKFHAI